MSNLDNASPVVRTAPVPPDRCGMALACAMLGDRWTMLIIREAFYGVTRFDDLRADLDAPRGILSTRLKTLVENGILERRPYREGRARIRHEYRLTDRGQDLALPLIALMEWGDRHLQQSLSPLQILSRSTGAPLRVALVTLSGQAVSPRDVTYAVTLNSNTSPTDAD